MRRRPRCGNMRAALFRATANSPRRAPMNANLSGQRIVQLAALCLWLLASGLAQAQTTIFVQNNTAHDFEVTDISVSGDPISKSAWKPGANSIAQGERTGVLTLNRSGKVNWMDPTPRFIEPGKTAVFTTTIVAGGGEPIKLRQKLLGTGKSSKMWYAIEGAEGDYKWEMDDDNRDGVWPVGSGQRIPFSFRAYSSNGHEQIEYVFGQR